MEASLLHDGLDFLVPSVQVLVTLPLFVLGCAAIARAVYNERTMQRHRQPGVSYRDVTFRRDGGWRRANLFTPAGLAHQRRASGYGVTGALLWVAALAAWVLLWAR